MKASRRSSRRPQARRAARLGLALLALAIATGAGAADWDQAAVTQIATDLYHAAVKLYDKSYKDSTSVDMTGFGAMANAQYEYMDRVRLLPTAMQVHMPNGSRDVYMFKLADATVNNKFAIFDGLFARPRVPRGWKHVVERPPAAQAANPQQKPAVK